MAESMQGAVEWLGNYLEDLSAKNPKDPDLPALRRMVSFGKAWQALDNQVFKPSFKDINLSLLTIRQQEVAYLVCQGKTNNEIAQILDLSSQTAKSHIKEIFSKLNVSRRSELAAIVAKAVLS